MYLSVIIFCYMNNNRFYVDSYLNKKTEENLLTNAKKSISSFKKMLNKYHKNEKYKFEICFYKTEYVPTLSYLYETGKYKSISNY